MGANKTNKVASATHEKGGKKAKDGAKDGSKRKPGKDVTNNLEAKLKEVTEQLERMKSKERIREDKKKKEKLKKLSLISKPKGQHGREYNIAIHFLKWTDEKGRKDFSKVLATVRDATLQAKLDCEMRFERHDPKRMAYITGQVKEKHPEMKRFENDWATIELVKQYLTNKRKALKEKGETGGAIKTALAAAQDDTSETEEGEAEGDENRSDAEMSVDGSNRGIDEE